MVKIGSNDITSKIGDKKLRLVSVSSESQEATSSSATTSGSPVTSGSAVDDSSVDDYVLTEKDKQGLAYEKGYHAIKDFYAHEIAMKNENPVVPKERNYRNLWGVLDFPEYTISIEYDIEKFMVLWTSKRPKKAMIKSSTLEELADEKRNKKISNVKMDYESRGRLRVLIDISLTVLKIGDVEKNDAIFLLKNAYLALYVAVGRIEGVDAYYISSIPMLRNTISVRDEWREIRDEWTRLRKTYPAGGSASTCLLLPSALVYEREKTQLTPKAQTAEHAPAEAPKAK